jgi:drug/metabolite transporter (DMT)-like permease
MSGIVSAIYSSFFLALSQASLKKSYREISPSVAFFIDSLFCIVLWIPLALFFGINLLFFKEVLIFAILSAILSEALYFYALSKGQLSLTTILLGCYPIYTILFSFLINKETLSILQILFISVMIFGTLISYLPSKLNMEELKKSGALLWPIIAAVGVGLSDTLSKKIINKTNDFTFLFALALVQIPVALIYLKLEKQHITKELKVIKRKAYDYKNAIAGSLFNVIGTGLLWIAFSKTFASIASPITATSGVLVIIISLLFLDEKISLRQILGTVFVFTGIIGITLVT